MEKVRPWCGQPSDRGRLRNRTEERRGHRSKFKVSIMIHVTVRGWRRTLASGEWDYTILVDATSSEGFSSSLYYLQYPLIILFPLIIKYLSTSTVLLPTATALAIGPVCACLCAYGQWHLNWMTSDRDVWQAGSCWSSLGQVRRSRT